MQIAYGYAGWIRVSDIGLPGPLYVRLRPTDRGRWQVTEVYLDGRGQRVTGAMLRTLPLAAIEAIAQADDEGAWLAEKDGYPGILLSDHASHFATTYGPKNRTWVAEAWRSQIATSDVKRVKPHRDSADEEYVRRPTDVPPLEQPAGRLTDDFLRSVTRAYAALVERGERKPAVVIADQTGVKTATARKWIYTARQRGIMPPGQQGRVG